MFSRLAVQGGASARSVQLAFVQAAFATTFAAAQVNAPVAPDAIYVGRFGANGGVSVIDLNGFGQSTGDPSFDFTYQSFPEGWSKYPLNPNLIQWGAQLYPPLFPGTTTLDGGSSGVFTLTRSAALDDRLLHASDVLVASDMMLGQPLDLVFHNGKDSTGCLSGGGNFCAVTGKKVLRLMLGGPHTVRPDDGTPGIPVALVPGAGNTISLAPHPNPPPIRATPLCANPYIPGEEPTSIWNATPPPFGPVLGPFANLLVPGDPFGVPPQIPPTGLLSSEQNAWFVGPDRNVHPSPASCLEHMVRQQIGHFLYVADRERDVVLVVNSNTFQVLEQIAVPNPTDFAMGPNLDYLAVSCRATDEVCFIDIQPHSATFHQVVDSVQVGDAPRGIAWDPGNEDVFVCNEGSNSVSIISTSSFNVRKVLSGSFNKPFAVAITQRQQSFGFFRNVYFAYILDRSGRVHLFESGPSGVNGWGYDAVIWSSAPIFKQPRAIQPDPRQLTSGVWIAHVGQLGPNGLPTGVPGGAVTNLVIDSAIVGIVPLTGLSAFLTPQLRDMELAIHASIGGDQLTGLPTDIAFDDQRNFGALPNLASVFGTGLPALLNGKSQVRDVAGVKRNTSEPRYMLLPVGDAVFGHAVDVIDLQTLERVDVNRHHRGVQSIPAEGARVVASYFRQ